MRIGVPRKAPAPVAATPLFEMKTCDICCCWIAPDGKASHLNQLGVGSSSHCGVAYKLGDSSGGRRLDKKGYLHVSYGDAFFADPKANPTQAQLNTLFDIQQELTRRGSGAGLARYLSKQAERETAS